MVGTWPEKKCLGVGESEEPERERSAMANFNAQYAEIAANFVEHFYKVFQQDRSQLHTVYHPEHSMLSFEGSAHQGREAIHNKYTSLPFGVSAVEGGWE